MTVDLDELERLRQIAMALWQPDTMHEWAPAQDAWSAALRNAFPALAKELRELRAQADDLRDVINGRRLPDAELSQDAAFVAMRFASLEEQARLDKEALEKASGNSWAARERLAALEEQAHLATKPNSPS